MVSDCMYHRPYLHGAWQDYLDKKDIGYTKEW